MEISRVKRNAPVASEDKKEIGIKKDFSQSFNFARDRKNGEQLKQMLDDIKKKGNRLVVTKCYSDVHSYKKMIQEYLKSVLQYMYNVKKDISFWQTQYFMTVETIDEKLKELTDLLLIEEKDNLKIAATIDEISGLVVDIYK
ncbi:YaaR family protein [Clostridium sp. YIM B02515]|uniref:YaaR family protein n=1 Tax=Clostridium rhizosphaerae TaxID=2803861 RepID=A0ABS1TD53_9CLOT|nr:YaaR family protein [Clostridium rhizosphaerae]MBL4936712.1 YaaR family protein [Clostridium rhizosphaerae]